jgi:S-formylglutathione hydrolase FrmB
MRSLHAALVSALVAPVALVALVAPLSGCSPSAPTKTATTTEQPATGTPGTAGGKGVVATRTIQSAALGVEKDYVVYTPAGYDADTTTRYPVIYVFHGLGGDERSWEDGGHISAAADELGLRAIIVMPDADDSFYADAKSDYDYAACIETGAGLLFPGQGKHATCVKHRAYETYLTTELVAEVDRTYRTIARREGRATAGMSMGGLGALALAMRHKDLYAAAASHSGFNGILFRGPHPYTAGKPETAELVTDVSTWGKELEPLGGWIRGVFGPDLANWKAHDPASLVADLAPGELALYLDCGTEDEFKFQDVTTYVHDLLVAKKIEHEFFIGPGAHNFAFWRPRLPSSLGFLAAHLAPAQ